MKSAKILIVDDSDIKRAMYKDQLDKEGYIIIEARDGMDGLEKAGKESPDVVIADMSMPKMGGLEMVQKLKRNDVTKYIPVICVSATYKDMENKLKALMEAGAEEYFYMPENLGELLQKVRIMLRIRNIYVELLEKNKQLKIFNDAAVGRELKMVELKEKVKKLETELAKHYK